MEVHELCQLFPEMSQIEFDELCEDIKKHGIIERIVTYEGKILDGRNRYKASQILDCDIYEEEWEGQCGTPFAFVASKNLHRRSLTPGQRAAIATEFKALIEAEYDKKRNASLKRGSSQPDLRSGNHAVSGESRAEAARLAGVSPRYVSEAGAIRKQSPDLFEQLKLGQKTIPEAKRELAAKERPDDAGTRLSSAPDHTLDASQAAGDGKQTGDETARVTQLGPTVMTFRESRDTANYIRGELKAICDLVAGMKEKRGWKTLRYDSWRGCAKAEFKDSLKKLIVETLGVKDGQLEADEDRQRNMALAEIADLLDGDAPDATAALDAVKRLMDGRQTA